MARSNGQLYLEVGANISNLKSQMTAARSAVLNWGDATGDVVDRVRKEFDNLGAGGFTKTAAEIDAGFKKTIATIKANAEELSRASSPGKAVQLLDAQASEEAARAKLSQAAALAAVARAAQTATFATEADATASRQLAASSAAAAIALEQEAAALNDNARVLRTVEGQLNATGAAHTQIVAAGARVTTSAGQTRAAMQQLGFQVNDVATQFSSGTPPMQIFAQQSGQVVQALQMMTNETKGFLGFLGSWQGALATAAVIALLPFVAKIIEGNTALDDAVAKLKKDATETDITARAKERFGTTVDGVTAALREQAVALGKTISAEQTAAEQANIAAKKLRERTAQVRADTVAQLENAKARLAALATPGATDARLSPAKDEAKAAVAALDALLEKANADLKEAERQLNTSRVDLAAEQAATAIDPIRAITKQYDDRIASLKAQQREEAKLGKQIGAASYERLRQLGAEKKAAIEAEQARQSAAKSANSSAANRQSGREIDVAQATAIIAAIGGRVTSGRRSTERQAQLYADKLAGRHDGPVAPPGTSAHETGNAIDIAYGPGITIARIRAAFAAEGVALRKVLNEPAQKVYHVEFGKAGPTAEAVAKRQQTEADKRETDAKAYADLLSRAQEEQVSLMRQRTTDIAAAAELDVQSVAFERDRLIATAQLGADTRRWSQTQADAVKTVLESNADMKIGAIRLKEAAQLADRRLAAEQDAIGTTAGLLQLQQGLATTMADRRRIALRLLELDEQEARIKAKRMIASDNPDVADQGRRDLQRINAEAPLRRASLDRQNADPVQRYFQQLQDSSGDTNEALMSVAAGGLRSVEDALVAIETGTETVSSAFSKMAKSILADLARIAAQKLISGLFGSLIGGIGGGSTASIVGTANKGLDTVFSDLKSFGFAEGGQVIGPGGPREDRIIARLSAGEFVVNAAAYARHPELVQAINAGRLPAFADGGFVGAGAMALPTSMPKLPSAASLSRSSSLALSMPISIDATGADPAAIARLARVVEQLQAELPGQIVSTVADAQDRLVLRGVGA